MTTAPPPWRATIEDGFRLTIGFALGSVFIAAIAVAALEACGISLGIW